jgi:pimeloyl-ACP methyl ester carboxylesterase
MQMKVRNVAAGDTLFLLRETGDGDGTSVLLLHGVPQTSSMWRDVAPALADSGRRVLAPDLPGLGGSSYAGPFDVAAVTKQIVALLDVEVPGRRVDVVGHDWGGSVALGLTGGYPERVRRLALANTVFRHVNLLRAPHIPFFAIPGAPEVLFRLGGVRVVETMLRLGWKSDVALDPEAKAEYVAAYSEPAKVHAMLGYYRAAARPRLAAALHLRPSPSGPPRVEAEQMLVLWGAADTVLPLTIGESIVKDLGARCEMVTVPGAGHFVIEEAPDVVRETLSRFLADAPA